MESFWTNVVAGFSGPAEGEAAAQTARALSQATGAQVYAESVAAEGGGVLALARRGLEKFILLAYPQERLGDLRVSFVFQGEPRRKTLPFGKVRLLECPADSANAAALRTALPWTAPQAIAGRPSIGLGDRLGLATPGHVRAVRGTGYVPMLAQQSIREMTRTRRSPEDVMNDATWGVFQTGFRTGFGSDADHLKSTDDIDRCADAGFTFYTIDPGDHVDDSADEADAGALAEAFDALPWDTLETTAADTAARYVGKDVALESGATLALDAAALHRAAVKYGRAVAHTAALYRHLVETLGKGAFELEVSVDETETPTSVGEHYYVAGELARLGVGWISLAPRFVGRFEKGVDYIGDRAELERTFVDHLAVARRFGDYKISLHSGSDKFGVYKMAARHGGHRVHVKTAGTSYLEALRVLAVREPALFREILAFARERYETDKATYHVSADLANVPAPEELADDALSTLLDQFDARQALHVTYGSVLTADDGRHFRGRLLEAVKTHEDLYAEVLEKHIGRHLEAFVKAQSG